MSSLAFVKVECSVYLVCTGTLRPTNLTYKSKCVNSKKLLRGFVYVCIDEQFLFE